MTAKDPRREAARDLMRELLEEAEIQRIEELTPEQMAEEAKGSGLAPGEGLEMLRRAVAAVDASGAAQPSPAPAANGAAKVAEAGKPKVVSLDERRRSRAGLFALLAAAALILLVIGAVWRNPMMRQQIDAWFSPKPTAPVPTHPLPIVPPTHEETPKEKADRLREAAYVDIQKGYFDYAWDELEDARDLDPDGNLDPRVRKAYADIENGPPKPPLIQSKPHTENWEQPLKKQPPRPR